MGGTLSCVRCGGAMIASVNAPARCSKCGAIAADGITTRSEPVRKPGLSRVAAGNRKSCARCGADITFAKRERDGSGAMICQACALSPASQAPSDDGLASLDMLEPEPAAIPLDTLSQLAVPQQPAFATAPATRSAPPPEKSPVRLIVGLSVTALLILIVG